LPPTILILTFRGLVAGWIAQLVEQRIENPRVPSSILGPATTSSSMATFSLSRARAAVIVFSLLCTMIAGTRAAESSRQLFSGSDLSDWDGATNLWRVENGSIVGETTAEHPLKHHSYLIWRGGKPENFELRLRFMIAGRRGNSGVQYRSWDLGDHEVGGYQYNIQPSRSGTTAVLEEMKNGRGGHLAGIGQKVHLLDKNIRKTTGTTGDQKAINASLDPKGWNELTIRAEGPRLRHWLNGHLAIDVIDDDLRAAQRGLIAFQLHSGPPMKIELKEIRLQDLDE
jgi:hypothetical protein